MTRSPAAVAVAIVVLVTASCGGKDPAKSAPSTTVVPKATTAPPATEAAVATTVAPTVPPTVAPTTTTTLSPKELAEAEVRAAYQSFVLQTDACFAAPTTCLPEEFDIDPELSAYRKRIADDFIALGRRSEPSPTEAAYSVVDGPIVFSDEGLTAVFDACTWDTHILVAGDPRVVVNDLNQTVRERLVLRKVGSRWYVSNSGPAGPDVVGRNDCGPRS
jgi:hypothetical protein